MRFPKTSTSTYIPRESDARKHLLMPVWFQLTVGIIRSELQYNHWRCCYWSSWTLMGLHSQQCNSFWLTFVTLIIPLPRVSKCTLYIPLSTHCVSLHSTISSSKQSGKQSREALQLPTLLLLNPVIKYNSYWLALLQLIRTDDDVPRWGWLRLELRVKWVRC